MLSIRHSLLVAVVATAVVIAGCGSSSSSQTSAPSSGSSPTTSTHATTQPAASGSSNQGAGALTADSRSAATGDIPDTQVFLVFTNPAAGYSIKYPEGWTRSGSTNDVTFRDKNNLVHVLISPGPAPTPASVNAQLSTLRRSQPSLSFSPAQPITIAARPVVKAVYNTESAPNPVTGRRVLLIVDRYELARAGRVATVDLATPQGVDNVDAYRMMIESFQWH